MYTRMSSCTKTLYPLLKSSKRSRPLLTSFKLLPIFLKIATKVTTNLMIYIGDSVGDLLCLLEADIGIVIASSSSLRKIVTHFGVSFFPLFSALIKKQKEHVEGSAFGWKGLSGVLYTVSSWAEVHSFIIGS
ncbi:putative HAD superfamily protein [Helianthus debilis subsp. tardiflorus]